MSKRSERLRQPADPAATAARGTCDRAGWMRGCRGTPHRAIVTVPHRLQMAACPAPSESLRTITSRRECSPSLLPARVPALRRRDADVRLFGLDGGGRPAGHGARAAFLGPVRDTPDGSPPARLGAGPARRPAADLPRRRRSGGVGGCRARGPGRRRGAVGRIRPLRCRMADGFAETVAPGLLARRWTGRKPQVGAVDTCGFCPTRGLSPRGAPTARLTANVPAIRSQHVAIRLRGCRRHQGV